MLVIVRPARVRQLWQTKFSYGQGDNYNVICLFVLYVWIWKQPLTCMEPLQSFSACRVTYTYILHLARILWQDKRGNYISVSVSAGQPLKPEVYSREANWITNQNKHHLCGWRLGHGLPNHEHTPVGNCLLYAPVYEFSHCLPAHKGWYLFVLLAEWPRITSVIPCMRQEFSSLQINKPYFESHQGFYAMENKRSFPWGKAAGMWSRTLTCI